MLLSQKSDHDGWNLYTACEEDRPLDWRPGMPEVVAIRGFAEFARPHQYPPGYKATARIDFPKEGKLHFFDFNKAHEHVLAALVEAINAQKLPPGR